jgi:hypothetical protein
VSECALNGSGKADGSEKAFRVDVVLAGFVDDAQIVRRAMGRSTEAAVDLSDLE